MNLLYTCFIFFIVACLYDDSNAMKKIKNFVFPGKSGGESSSSKSTNPAYEKMDKNERNVLYEGEVAGIKSCIKTCFSSLKNLFKRYDAPFPEWEQWFEGVNKMRYNDDTLPITVAKNWLSDGTTKITENMRMNVPDCDGIINTAQECIVEILRKGDLRDNLFDDVLNNLSNALKYGQSYEV